MGAKMLLPSDIFSTVQWKKHILVSYSIDNNYILIKTFCTAYILQFPRHWNGKTGVEDDLKKINLQIPKTEIKNKETKE
jgi:hypothetical protein